jgi:hypothetical protein
MAYTMGQAARVTGISKPRLSRAIKAGKISAERQDDGSYTIDPAELHRVYPATVATTVTTRQPRAENRLLDEVRARLADAQDQVADLRQRLTEKDRKLDDAHARIAGLLSDQRPAAPRRSWWTWMRRLS